MMVVIPAAGVLFTGVHAPLQLSYLQEHVWFVMDIRSSGSPPLLQHERMP